MFTAIFCKKIVMYNSIQKTYRKYNSSISDISARDGIEDSNGGNIELEFRIKYDFRSDLDLIRKIISDSKSSSQSNEKTINCIKYAKQTNRIYQVLFTGSTSEFLTKNSPKIINTYTKRELGKPIFGYAGEIKYKMAISEEKDIKKFNAESCDAIRMKNRLCIYNPSGLSNWRLDITLVKSFDYVEDFNLSDLDKYVVKIFPKGLSVDNFMDNVERIFREEIYLAELEIELEYIGPRNIVPPKKSIDECLKFISMLLLKPGGKSKQESDNSLSYELLARIARWIRPSFVHDCQTGICRLKNLAPKVVGLDIIKAHYKLMPNIDNYFITPKTDGDRTVLIFDHDKDKYFSISHEAKELNLLDFGCNVKGGNDKEKYPNETILDTEYYVDASDTGKYYIFDVIAYKGEPVFEKDYEDRIIYIDKILSDFEGCSNLVKKTTVKLGSNWKNELTKILKKKWDFETDGWIFTPAKTRKSDNMIANYTRGETWKWKPVDVLSIDFLLKNNVLYSGIRKVYAEKILPELAWDKNYSTYGPVVFTPTYIPMAVLDGTDISNFNDASDDNIIIELIWRKNKWEMLRVREDRQSDADKGDYFGNDHRVAELVWHSIFWPLEPDHFLKNKMINNADMNFDGLHSVSVINENKLYFYKLYSFLLKKIIHKDIYVNNKSNFSLVDAGVFFPFYNFILRFGMKNIDFVVSDGFSCLNIINQKYDKRFVGDAIKHVNIRAFKPEDYDMVLKKEKNTARAYISLFPTKEQILHIKNVSLSTERSKIKIYVVVDSKRKGSLGGSFYAKKITSVFMNYGSRDSSSSLSDIYLLEY